jgi:hypothetical protein
MVSFVIHLALCLKWHREPGKLTVVCAAGAVIPFNNISSSLLLERDYFVAPPSGCALTQPNLCQNDQYNPPTSECPGGEFIDMIRHWLLPSFAPVV